MLPKINPISNKGNYFVNKIKSQWSDISLSEALRSKALPKLPSVTELKKYYS